MKVTQEKLPASQIGLEIEITPEMTKQTYNQVINNLVRTANIPGFRKGKVPRQVLLQKFGSTRLKAAAVEELIQDGIEKAIKQEDIKAIGQPQLRSSFDDLVKNYEPGQPLTFQAAVDVPPEVKLDNYSGLQVKAEEITYDPSKVDQVLEENRKEMATLIPVEGRPAQIGDVAIVDFKGVLAKAEDGDENAEPEPIPGGEATDFQIDVQEDKFIPGFIAGMVGMNPGETKEISAQFPDPYSSEELAGKPATFTVTLKELKEKELPELNDDFAQEVSDFDTLAELRASLEERYQKEAAEQTKKNKQQALAQALVEKVEVELPDTLVQQEVDAMLTQTAIQLSRQGLDVRKLFTADIIPQLRDRSRPEAMERLKRTLALREVSKRESITISAEEIKTRVQELLTQYADEDVDEDRLQEVVEDELLTEKIFTWLEEHATIELVPEGTLNQVSSETDAETVATETSAQTPETTSETTASPEAQ
ncbi:MAG: trigger factor [Nostocaceae cyanobacterium]|nr:trigger factor [Nostocaceae cyanobacterium]